MTWNVRDDDAIEVDWRGLFQNMQDQIHQLENRLKKIENNKNNISHISAHGNYLCITMKDGNSYVYENPKDSTEWRFVE